MWECRATKEHRSRLLKDLRAVRQSANEDTNPKDLLKLKDEQERVLASFRNVLKQRENSGKYSLRIFHAHLSTFTSSLPSWDERDVVRGHLIFSENLFPFLPEAAAGILARISVTSYWPEPGNGRSTWTYSCWI